MQIYGIKLHFFVMNNLFHEKDETGANLAIHEKYDIKESTVNRSSVPPVEGQVATCTHCEQKFVYSKKKKAKKAKIPMVLAATSGKSSSDVRASIINIPGLSSVTSMSNASASSDQEDFDSTK
jgi:hypothetical protein